MLQLDSCFKFFFQHVACRDESDCVVQTIGIWLKFDVI